MKLQLIFQSPATAPVLLTSMGAFGNRLSEQSEFSIDAHDSEQHREFRRNAVGGVFLFGYFILDKQNKVSRKSRESDHFQFAEMVRK